MSSQEESKNTKAQPPNCLKCQHFYITWDEDLPKGCKIFNFKSQTMPAQVVFKNSGQNCQAYEEKKNFK